MPDSVSRVFSAANVTGIGSVLRLDYHPKVKVAEIFLIDPGPI
jgi:hypothetical protein